MENIILYLVVAILAVSVIILYVRLSKRIENLKTTISNEFSKCEIALKSHNDQIEALDEKTTERLYDYGDIAGDYVVIKYEFKHGKWWYDIYNKVDKFILHKLSDNQISNFINADK